MKHFLTLCFLFFTYAYACPVELNLGPLTLNEGIFLTQLCQPFWDSCPIINVEEPQALFCGIGPDMKWKNYTFRCQAKNDGALAYYDYGCSCNYITCNDGYECINANCIQKPGCENIVCDSGFTCIGGVCQEDQPTTDPDSDSDNNNTAQCTSNGQCAFDQQCINQKCQKINTCQNVVCQYPQDCLFGVCYRRYDYFCSAINPQIQRHYCPINRQFPNCVFSSNAPLNQIVCGTDYAGESYTFSGFCQACIYDHIDYVLPLPCSQLPEDRLECQVGQLCSDQKKCQLIDFCQDITCPRGKFCNNGVCLRIRNFCQGNSDCQEGFQCNDGNVCQFKDIQDPCLFVQCGENQQCFDGLCVDLCFGVQCPQGSQCKDGQCLIHDPCHNVDCSQSSTCVEGQCVPIDLCQNVNCNVGQECVNGICQSKSSECDTICQPDYSCKNGVCMQNRCFTNKECQHNESVCIGSFCMYNRACQADFQCYGAGNCVNNVCRRLQ